VLVFLGAHVGLAALVLGGGATVATAHAYLTVAGAILICALARSPQIVVALAAYVAGCDVFWRMSQAHVPWELGKYLLAGVAVAGLIRFVPRPQRIGLPVVFVALLVPGSWITVEALGFDAAIDPLSFNLAGLVALALLVMLTGNLWSTRMGLVDVLWVCLGPIVTVTALAWSGARGLSPDDFQAGASSLLASGSYGPNQVSTVVGLGSLLVGFLIAFDRRMILKVLAGLLLVWFVTEAGLTFSRGGLLNVSVALVLAGPHLAFDRRRAIRFLGLALACAGVLAVVVIPTAQQLTGDRFGERYTSFTTTLRRDIAVADLHVFFENPVLGVGVGRAVAERDLDEPLATHTEYTRMLAEHGILGVLALITLAAMAVRSYRRQDTLLNRAWAIALLGWAMSSMVHTATRTASVSFAFGLAGLVLASAPEERLRRRRRRPATATTPGQPAGVEA
jgi:O-Antigen ligase